MLCPSALSSVRIPTSIIDHKNNNEHINSETATISIILKLNIMMLKEKLITPKKSKIRDFDYCCCKYEFNSRTKILFLIRILNNIVVAPNQSINQYCHSLSLLITCSLLGRYLLWLLTSE
jgi:hypothetical protein